jgi:glyoxylate/hydroxypyruvate/2-ketogluconate reductase
MNADPRPKVLVARHIFPQVVAHLGGHFEVEANERPVDWSYEELIHRLQGKAGAFISSTERIDAALLDACPGLRALCTMTVGYNNIDVAACTARW